MLEHADLVDLRIACELGARPAEIIARLRDFTLLADVRPHARAHRPHASAAWRRPPGVRSCALCAARAGWGRDYTEARAPAWARAGLRMSLPCAGFGGPGSLKVLSNRSVGV